MGVLDWLKEQWEYNIVLGMAASKMNNASNLNELNTTWDALTDKQKADPHLMKIHEGRMKYLDIEGRTLTKPFEIFIGESLDKWLALIAKYQTSDPVKAKENLTKLTADVMTLAGTSAAIDIGLGMVSPSAGDASALNTKQMLAWLGVGAVVAAVAHDPVKIGLLRPYQDSLEQTFRNRRPDDNALFQAYRTRELSPIKIDDLSKLTYEEMNRVEADNDAEYFRQISRWGYSEAFALSLSRSATRTLNFSQLVTLARAGIYDKGLSIYSLWGEGLDRVVMPAALTAIETLRDREMYSGFRSMIEPSYIEGDIPEADLVAYWNLAGVPGKVQAWVLPRLKKRREAYTLKQAGSAAVRERDLTVSQVQQAYQNMLMDRARAQNMIIALGYSLEEAKILLDLAELRRKLPAAQTLKRLTLTDYEKAHKNGLITREDVLERMRGEYAPGDIELERKLLEIGKA